jgi:putative CocE/NonD family hydrolase
VYHYWWWQGGAFRLSFNVAWAILLAADNLRHYPERTAALAKARDHVWVTTDQMKALDIKPLYRDWDQARFGVIEGVFGNDWFAQFMRNDQYGAFWQPYDFHRQHAEMDIPMLHVAGWYDTFLQGTIDSYSGLRSKARSADAGRAQKLIVGPWQHVSWGLGGGRPDFGPELMKLNASRSAKRWFDHWLKGRSERRDGRAAVLIFVMGENVWRAEDE